MISCLLPLLAHSRRGHVLVSRSRVVEPDLAVRVPPPAGARRSPVASGMALARMMAALALQILMIRTGEGSRAASRDRSSSSEVATIAPNAWAIRTT